MGFSNLSAEDVILIHDLLLADFKRNADPIGAGVRDWALLESAVGRQAIGYAGVTKYDTIQHNAATLFYGVAMNHAFIDGNKRTALVTLLAYLDKNVMLLDCDEKDLFDFVLKVVEHRLDNTGERESVDIEIEKIASWIYTRMRRIDKRNYPLQFRRLKQILADYGFKMEMGRNQVKFSKGKLSKVVHYDGDGIDLSKDNISGIRKDLQLDESHGIDSERFYSSEDIVDDFISRYRTTLRDLSNYDKQTRSYQ